MAGKHAKAGTLTRATHELNGRIHAEQCTPKHRAEVQSPEANLGELLAERRERKAEK